MTFGDGIVLTLTIFESSSLKELRTKYLRRELKEDWVCFMIIQGGGILDEPSLVMWKNNLKR